MRGFWLVLAIGCGGGTSGEPATGTVTLNYGDEKPKMIVGAAVQSDDTPSQMLVQIGSDNVDCDSYLDVFLDFDVPAGSFVYFSVEKAPAMTAGTVSVMKSGSSSIKVNEGPGSITIDTVDARVTGTVTFATNDTQVGPILVAGTFDVKRCF